MTAQVTQHPTNNETYARNTVPDIIITASDEIVTAVLSLFGGETLYTGQYTPNFSNNVNIDLRGIYDEYLATEMPGASAVTTQYQHRLKFQCVVTGSESGAIGTYEYYVCNSTLLSSSTFATFASSRFMTNQPYEKFTCLDSPEYLTWYDHQGDWYVNVRFYTRGGGQENILLVDDAAIGVYTMDVSYSRLIQLSEYLPSQLLTYYDVIVYNNKDVELARQRYVYFERTGREKFYLFVNALGGVDTLICQGANSLQPEITHNIGRLSDAFVALDDTLDVRVWSQTIGPMPWRWRDWIYELVSAKQGAVLVDGDARRPIVISGCEIGMADDGQLASASFLYRLSDITNTLSQNERDMSLHASVADEASDELDDLTETEELTWEDGQQGYSASIEVPATKLYVTFDPSETGTVYVLINGQLETEVNCATARRPFILETTSGDLVTFEMQDEPAGDIVVNYYTDETYTSQAVNPNTES